MAVANVPIRLPFHTLLVATDLSAPSKAAVACASTIARRSNARVLVAHVISPERWALTPEDLHPALCQTRRNIEKKMAGFLKTPALAGVAVEAIVKQGDFRSVLCGLLREHAADLLIVSTHGRKGLKKLLLGSKVEGVCQVAPCPILLVGPNTPQREMNLQRILFPTDLSATSLGALPCVLALAAQHGSTIRFLRVLADEHQDRQAALKQLQEDIGLVVTQRAGLAKAPEFQVEVGVSPEVILRVAGGWPADLVGIGAHRPSTLASHLPGDVAYDVASEAHCPVLTISD